MTKNDEERRAFELLQWVPYGLPADFDDGLAQAGYYSKIQRQRSDEALDAFDAAHPYETSPELAAFSGAGAPSHLFSPHPVLPVKSEGWFPHTDDSKSFVSPEALNDHKALLRDVQQAAVAVISDEPDPFLQSQRLRLMAEELGCPISERTAATYLARARGEISGVSVPRMKGERMDTTPTPWAWEGVIMAGTSNLLVAPPKVGKSALMDRHDRSVVARR